MMHRIVPTLPLRHLAVALCVLLPGLSLTSCGSTPKSSFYVLTPTENPASGEPSMRVALELVTVLPSVDRPQMLLTVGANQRSLREFDRWASPLPENMTRVLEMNLESQLGLTSVYVLPSRYVPPVDAIVTVEILQLDAFPNGTCAMIAQFDVADGKGNWITSGQLTVNPSDATSTAQGPSAVAQNISSSLGRLSKLIAQTLQDNVKVKSKPPAGN